MQIEGSTYLMLNYNILAFLGEKCKFSLVILHKTIVSCGRKSIFEKWNFCLTSSQRERTSYYLLIYHISRSIQWWRGLPNPHGGRPPGCRPLLGCRPPPPGCRTPPNRMTHRLPCPKLRLRTIIRCATDTMVHVFYSSIPCKQTIIWVLSLF